MAVRPGGEIAADLDDHAGGAADGGLIADKAEDQIAAVGGELRQLGEVVGGGGSAEHILDSVGDAVAVFVRIRVIAGGWGIAGGPGVVGGDGAGGQVTTGIERKRGESGGGDEGELGA